MSDQNSLQQIRDSVSKLCSDFDSKYWQEIDEKSLYPEKFIEELTKSGWLSVLIPQDYGGSGLGILEASVILEEINRSGGNSGVCHAQMYIMGTLLRHGNNEQKEKFLTQIASGKLRLQSFGVTEPTTGSDTTRIKTTAIKKSDRYVVNGQKVWTSRFQNTDLMLLLARTKPLDKIEKKIDGLSVFLVDVKNSKGISSKPIRNMVNHETNEVFFDDLEIPIDNLIGKENEGFKYILDGMNAERALIAAECIGDGRWFIEKAVNYANDREVFDRKIGMNQGIQFPIAKAYTNIEAADLMRYKACELFDQKKNVLKRQTWQSF